jgi:hypothetical protein
LPRFGKRGEQLGTTFNNPFSVGGNSRLRDLVWWIIHTGWRCDFPAVASIRTQLIQKQEMKSFRFQIDDNLITL